MMDQKIGRRSMDVAYETYTQDRPWWHVVMRVIAFGLMILGIGLLIGGGDSNDPIVATTDLFVQAIMGVAIFIAGYGLRIAFGGKCVIDPVWKDLW